MKTCSANNCKNQVRFRFPKDDKLRKKWMKSINRLVFKPDRDDGLCSVHFCKEDFHFFPRKYG